MWFGFTYKPYTGVCVWCVCGGVPSISRSTVTGRALWLLGEPLATTRGKPHDGDCVAYDNQAKGTHVGVNLIQREVGEVCVDSVGLHCYRASGALLPGERW